MTNIEGGWRRDRRLKRRPVRIEIIFLSVETVEETIFVNVKGECKP